MKPDEKRCLDQLVTHTKETLALFSNKNKGQRERMIACAFLRCVGIEFETSEIVIGKDEPVDISFRSAQLQIMEILGGRKRGLELRERLKRYQAAKCIEDVVSPPNHIYADVIQ
jgi:hypothetical protein